MNAKYFKTYADAKVISDTLGPYVPSRYLSEYEIANGSSNVKIREFDKVFAIQLGDFVAYYPNTENITWEELK